MEEVLLKNWLKKYFSRYKFDISVIVPIYNVEEYLEECLDSIRNQTKSDLQVIMIDDGSTDSSGKIAAEYARKYDNFEYYRIPNQGLGHARNYAMQYVLGKYVVFIDSDDVVTSEIYQNMFDVAEKNKSELTICNVARFNSKKVWLSKHFAIVFKDLPETPHITKDHSLLYDSTSWNKLILTSFYKKHNFQFPEGILYEDIPVTMPMHYLAKNVRAVNKVGYLWRVRDGISKSITQNVDNMKNLLDRITVMKMVDRFFDENVTDEGLKESKQLKFLEVDLNLFVDKCHEVSRQQAFEMFEVIREYINSAVDKQLLNRLSVICKQKYHCVMNNDLDGLLKVLNNANKGYHKAPVEENNGRFFVKCSDDIFTISDRDITDELRKITPNSYINDITVGKTFVEIYAHTYIPRVNIENSSQQDIKAYLFNQRTLSIYPLDVEPYENKVLTAAKGYAFNPNNGEEINYNYDGTGFKIKLNLEKIDINKLNSGENRILIKYKNRVSKGEFYLCNTAKNTAIKIKDNTCLVGNKSIRLDINSVNEIIVDLCNHDNFITKSRFLDGKVSLTLEHTAKAVYAVDTNGNIVDFVTKDYITFNALADSFKDGESYSFFIVKKSGLTEYLMRRTKSVSVEDLGDNAAVVMSNKTYRLGMNVYGECTSVTAASIEDSVISLKTKSMGNDKFVKNAVSAALVVDDEIAGEVLALAKSDCVNNDGKILCEFTVDFDDENVTKNLYNSYRQVFVEYILNDGNVVRQVLYTPKYFKYVLELDTLKIEFYRFKECGVRLHAQYVWKESENTPQKRQEILLQKYPQYQKEPINPKRIMFESMWGSKYSCNPQHLYEYIDKNYPDYECIWSMSDPRTPIKGNGVRVKRGSDKYYYYLATSKYFVNNVNFEDSYCKREGQIEVQTMHGTPLKTMGLDVKNDFKTQQSIDDYIRRNSRWNYLVVQGDFMAEKAYPCFKCDCEILKTGYPRTDVLFDNSEEKINKIKKDLNIPLDKKVILYVPTWRIRDKFDMKLEIEDMRKKLGDEYVLLIRLHHFCSKGYEIPADNEFVFDFNKYRSVEDLYLISDILITDYSSVMFDYATMRKPMIFFTYDIKEYADNLRGMYIDIEKEAPGPLVYTYEQLVDTILNIDEEMENCKDRVEDFNKKYVNHECANSCEKVFSTVFKNN